MTPRAGNDGPLLDPESLADPGRVAVEAGPPHDHERRAARAKNERRMLFAATGFTRSLHALERAYELASRSHGTLYVLQVAGKSGERGVERERAIAKAALRSVRRSCDRGLAELLPRDQLMVKHGEFDAVVTQTARELDAELVVIPGAEQCKGNAIAQIARLTQVPVLVARRSAVGGGIVAATDFADPECDELRHAAAFATQLSGKLAFVHNIKPIVHAVSNALGYCACTVIEPSAQALAECRQRLQALAAFFGVYADTRVVSRPSAEDAILEVARETRADLIVVGAREQGWLERLFGTALAARIVDRCERSVLVAPLCASRPARALVALN